MHLRIVSIHRKNMHNAKSEDKDYGWTNKHEFRKKERERERAWKPIVPIATTILSIDGNPLEIKELMYNA